MTQFLALGGPLHTQLIDYDGPEPRLTVPAAETDAVVQHFTYRRAELRYRDKTWWLLVPEDIPESETKGWATDQILTVMARKHIAADRILFGVGLGQTRPNSYELKLITDVTMFGVFRNGILSVNPVKQMQTQHVIDAEVLTTAREPRLVLCGLAAQGMNRLLTEAVVQPMLDQAAERHKWPTKN